MGELVVDNARHGMSKQILACRSFSWQSLNVHHTGHYASILSSVDEGLVDRRWRWLDG